MHVTEKLTTIPGCLSKGNAFCHRRGVKVKLKGIFISALVTEDGLSSHSSHFTSQKYQPVALEY
jgi:hypothetical protein